jgi:hypothetical protein
MSINRFRALGQRNGLPPQDAVPPSPVMWLVSRYATEDLASVVTRALCAILDHAARRVLVVRCQARGLAAKVSQSLAFSLLIDSS